MYVWQPCLHSQRKLFRVQQARIAASRRLSCSSRVDPIAKVASKLQSYDSFTARLRPAAAYSSSSLQVMNSFTARLGQTSETASELEAIDSFTARLGPAVDCV